MLAPRIQQHFIDSADLHYQIATSLSLPIENAVNALVNCLTNGGKVLICGSGSSAANAQHFAGNMMSSLERERPGLACLALSESNSLLSADAHVLSFSQIYSRQINALGQAGDILIALCAEKSPPLMMTAIESAIERDMTVIALTGIQSDDLLSILRDVDVAISIPSPRSMRVQEVHLLVLHCLSDGLDAQLLGSDELKEVL